MTMNYWLKQFFKSTKNFLSFHHKNKKRVYYSFFISFNISLSLIFVLFTASQEFFPLNATIFITVFTTSVASSSDSYLILLKNALRTTFASFLGCLFAYISYVIFADELWPVCFVQFIMVFITSAIFVSSKTIPFPQGKSLYLNYFFLVFYYGESRSPIIFLKFYLTSLCMVGVVFFSCIVLNPFFSSTLFIWNATKVLNKSKEMFILAGHHIHDLSVRLAEQDTPVPEDITPNTDPITRHRKHSNKVLASNPFYPIDIYNLDLPVSYSTRSVERYYDIEHSIKNNAQNERQRIRKHLRHLPQFLINHLEEEEDMENISYRKKILALHKSYSKKLLGMDKYFEESKKEEWNYSIMPLFKDLLFLLERNHKELLSIHLSIMDKVSKNRAKWMLPLLPSINTIIEESGKIFSIMEKQLSNYYIRSDLSETGVLDMRETLRQSQSRNPHELSALEVSLDYSQYKILESFECIESIISNFKENYEQMFQKDLQLYGIDFDETTVDYELAALHFFFTSIFKFASDQKVLSSIVYQIALMRNDHFQAFKLVQCYWFKLVFFLQTHLNKKERKRHKEVLEEEKHYNYPFPPFLCELNPYTTKEKATLIGRNIIKRLLSDWRFSFRFALAVSSLSVAYHEILEHSNFILFQNLNWLVITVTFVMGPTVGGSVFFSILRIVGTCMGAMMAYVVAVLFTRSQNNVADSFIFLSCTFFIYFALTLFVREKSIQNVVNFLILTYATISFPMFVSGELTIITSLLRMYHIVMGCIFILLFSLLIFPTYEYMALEKDMLRNTTLVTSSFHHLLSYTLDIEGRRKKIGLVQMKSKIQKEIREIGYLIAKSQSKLFHSKFELFFQPQKYHRLKDILHLNERLFVDLVSLEYIQSSIPEFVIQELKSHRLTVYLKLLITEVEGTSQTIKDILCYDDSTRMASQDNSIDILEQADIEFQKYFHDNAKILRNGKKNASLYKLEALGSTMHSLESFVKTFNLLRHFLWVHLGVRVIKRVSSPKSIRDRVHNGDLIQGEIGKDKKGKEKEKKVEFDSPTNSTVTFPSSSSSPSDSVASVSASSLSTVLNRYHRHYHRNRHFYTHPSSTENDSSSETDLSCYSEHSSSTNSINDDDDTSSSSNGKVAGYPLQ